MSNSIHPHSQSVIPAVVPTVSANGYTHRYPNGYTNGIAKRTLEAKIVVPWDQRFSESWGFQLYATLASVGNESTPHKEQQVHSSLSQLYGTVGPLVSNKQVKLPSYLETDERIRRYIPLPQVQTYEQAVSLFTLATGLWIVETAQVEFGDKVVVAGNNLLAHMLLAAAHQQGATTFCIAQEDNLDVIRALLASGYMDQVIPYTVDRAFESTVNEFVAAGPGQSVLFDTTGQPTMIQELLIRVPRLGTLLLCRPDIQGSLLANIYRFIHRQSANVRYWSGVKNPADAYALDACCRRATVLLAKERLRFASELFTA